MTKIFTTKEVEQHSDRSDIWMVIEGKNNKFFQVENSRQLMPSPNQTLANAVIMDN